MGKLLTIEQVAEKLQVSKGTIRNWIYVDKTLPAYKVGNNIRISSTDIEKFIEKI